LSTGSNHKTQNLTNHDNFKYVIRATSDPCQQESTDNLDGIYCGGGDNTLIPGGTRKVNDRTTTAEGPDLNPNRIAVDNGELTKQPSDRRYRGRPKKRVRRPEVTGLSIPNSPLKMICNIQFPASKKRVTHQVPLSAVELHDEDDENDEEVQCKHWPSSRACSNIDLFDQGEHHQ